MQPYWGDHSYSQKQPAITESSCSTYTTGSKRSLCQKQAGKDWRMNDGVILICLYCAMTYLLSSVAYGARCERTTVHFKQGILRWAYFCWHHLYKPGSILRTISTVKIRIKIALWCKGWYYVLPPRTKQHAGLACRQIGFSSRKCSVSSPLTNTNVADNITVSLRENWKIRAEDVVII